MNLVPGFAVTQDCGGYEFKIILAPEWPEFLCSVIPNNHYVRLRIKIMTAIIVLKISRKRSASRGMIWNSDSGTNAEMLWVTRHLITKPHGTKEFLKERHCFEIPCSLLSLHWEYNVANELIANGSLLRWLSCSNMKRHLHGDILSAGMEIPFCNWQKQLLQ